MLRGPSARWAETRPPRLVEQNIARRAPPTRKTRHCRVMGLERRGTDLLKASECFWWSAPRWAQWHAALPPCGLSQREGAVPESSWQHHKERVLYEWTLRNSEELLQYERVIYERIHCNFWASGSLRTDSLQFLKGGFTTSGFFARGLFIIFEEASLLADSPRAKSLSLSRARFTMSGFSMNGFFAILKGAFTTTGSLRARRLQIDEWRVHYERVVWEQIIYELFWNCWEAGSLLSMSGFSTSGSLHFNGRLHYEWDVCISICISLSLYIYIYLSISLSLSLYIYIYICIYIILMYT